MAELTDTERDMLAFERQWFRYMGAKENAIYERFGCTMTRYFARLDALIWRPEAVAFDVLTVRRLQRVAEGRRGARRRG